MRFALLISDLRHLSALMVARGVDTDGLSLTRLGDLLVQSFPISVGMHGSSYS